MKNCITMKANLVDISLAYLHLIEQRFLLLITYVLYIDFACVVYNYRHKEIIISVYLKIN